MLQLNCIKVDKQYFEYTINDTTNLYNMEKTLQSLTTMINTLSNSKINGNCISMSDITKNLKGDKTDYRTLEYLNEESYPEKIDGIDQILKSIVLFMADNYETKASRSSISDLFAFWAPVEFDLIFEIAIELKSRGIYNDTQMSDIFIGILHNIISIDNKPEREKIIRKILDELYKLDTDVYFSSDIEWLSYLMEEILNVLITDRQKLEHAK